MSTTENDVGVLVIGFGNPLRGDDGAGCYVVQQLAQQGHAKHLTTMEVHQLMPELAAPISNASRVIFVDAAQDLPAGLVSTSSIAPSPAGLTEQPTMTHHLDPPELLALARRVFGRCPPAELLAIGACEFDVGERLSPVVQFACDRVVEHLTGVLTTATAHA